MLKLFHLLVWMIHVHASSLSLLRPARRSILKAKGRKAKSYGVSLGLLWLFLVEACGPLAAGLGFAGAGGSAFWLGALRALVQRTSRSRRMPFYRSKIHF